ncbi:MAG: hypothetical protein KF752_11715 [Pirellulaceae bacterium]|nr:hypothetical protein [Pirellulaceae bacterium]
MKIQMIVVALVAMLTGMLTKGPELIQASSSPPAMVQLDSALTGMEQQLDSIEKLVGYRARWTHPGTIESHLRQHGIDPTGMTRDQMLAEHDAIHDVVGPVKAGQPIPQVSQVRYAISGDCPGGACPIPRPSRPTANVVEQAASTAVNVVAGAVAPPYRQSVHSDVQNYGSTGYSSGSYSGGNGYSTTVYSTQNYGSGSHSNYSSSRRIQPVRSFIRGSFFQRLFGWR